MRIVPGDPNMKNKPPNRKFEWWHGVVTLLGSGLLVLAFITYKNPIVENSQVNSLIAAIQALVGLVLIASPLDVFSEQATIIRTNEQEGNESYYYGMFRWLNSVWYEITAFVLAVILTVYFIYFY